MKVKDLKGFPDYRHDLTPIQFRQYKQGNGYHDGFNDALDLIGNLDIPEQGLERIDEKEVLDFYYNDFRKWEIKHTDIGDFIKAICQRFGQPVQREIDEEKLLELAKSYKYSDHTNDNAYDMKNLIKSIPQAFREGKL